MSNDLIILEEILDQDLQNKGFDYSKSEYFEIFVAEEILKDYDLSHDDITGGIVDGGGDGGIDSIYFFLNGRLIRESVDHAEIRSILESNMTPNIHLYIIQSKRERGFSETALIKLISTTNDILSMENYESKDNENLSKYNRRLLEIGEYFVQTLKRVSTKHPNIMINYYFVTLAVEQPHPNANRAASKLEQCIRKLYNRSTCSVEFWGASRLLESTRVQARQNLELVVSDHFTTSDRGIGYICLAKVGDYFRFISEGREKPFRIAQSLFEPNVRDYQGKTLVNKQIRETLALSPSDREDFWWLNNGVTILTSKATLSGRTLTLENPAIVNGLQTSWEIFEHHKDGEPFSDTRKLLIRVLETTSEEIADKVIKATNSQNPIPTASLFSSEKIHKDIEQLLRTKDLYYDRRKNFYKNKGMSVSKIISIAQLAQAVMSMLLQRPNDARARPTSLLSNDGDYQAVFDPNHPILLYYACTLIIKKIEHVLRKTNKDLQQRSLGDIKFHVAMYVVAMATNKVKPEPEDIRALLQPNEQLSQIVSDELIEKAIGVVSQIYSQLGMTNEVAKGKKFAEAVRDELKTAISSSHNQK